MISRKFFTTSSQLRSLTIQIRDHCLLSIKTVRMSKRSKEIRIGTCSFRIGKEAYARKLSTVEIQHTFYTPPSIATLKRWRSEMPSSFEFTLKAWQLITHESSSPTYRRIKKPLSEKVIKEAGSFSWTATVRDAWNATLDAAEALEARTVLFQCPATFIPSPRNVRRMRKFFSSIDRCGKNLAWEPRGPMWNDVTISSLCNELDLWHAVDPFARRSTTPTHCYFRMHGRVRWRYTYEVTELEELATLLPRRDLSYVFFNNITMIDDALSFQSIVRG